MKPTKEQVLKNLEDIVRFGGSMMSSEFVESVRIAMEAYENHQDWIPIKTRPLTEEEKAEMGTESPYMYDCLLPDDGEEVEVTTYLGDVTLDVFCRDSSGGCYFEHYCDDGDVLAWRHKPEPYKAESEDKDADSD